MRKDPACTTQDRGGRTVLLAGLLLVPLLLAAPTGEAEFITTGSLMTGAPLDGWEQPGTYSVWDGTNETDMVWRNTARAWFAIGTEQGGSKHASTDNLIERVYFRMDHWGPNEVPQGQINWNIQLNLGGVGPHEVDHLLRFRVQDPGDVLVGLLQYDEPHPIGAFTTGAVEGLWSSEPQNQYGETRTDVVVNTGSWGDGHYGMEIGLPVAWLVDPAGSFVKADGSGTGYITGAMFSSVGQFHAVGSVQDEFMREDGEIVVLAADLVTGQVNFEGILSTDLGFVDHPADTPTNEPLPAVRLEILDSDGERVLDAGHEVTLTFESDPSGGTARLLGTTTVAAVDGVATFSDLKIDTVGQDYTLRASAPGLTGSVSLPFDVLEPPSLGEVVVDFSPVLADGSKDAGARWGGWQADPGTKGVTSMNFLKVTNTGSVDEVTFTLAFTQPEFSGEDGDWTIPIEDNLRFACAETHEEGSAPSELAFTFGEPSQTGSTTCSFSEGSAGGFGVIYIQYELVTVPPVVPNQAYFASFTVTVGG